MTGAVAGLIPASRLHFRAKRGQSPRFLGDIVLRRKPAAKCGKPTVAKSSLVLSRPAQSGVDHQATGKLSTEKFGVSAVHRHFRPTINEAVAPVSRPGSPATGLGRWGGRPAVVWASSPALRDLCRACFLSGHDFNRATDAVESTWASQSAEKLPTGTGPCQGTTPVVPKMPQNDRRALQVAEKLFLRRCFVAANRSQRPGTPRQQLSD